MRKWLKPEVWLLVSGVVLAVALAFGVFSFFLTSSAYITMRTALEAEASWWVDSLMPVYESLEETGFLILCVLFLAFGIAYLRSISDKFTFGRLRSVKGVALWLFAASVIIASYLVPIVASFDTIGGDLPTLDSYLKAMKLEYLLPILGFAIIWVLAGPDKSQDGRRQNMLYALRGAVVGTSVVLLNYLGDIAGDISGETYYVYHGKPYEYNPYIYQHYASIIFLNYLTVLVGSAAVAMALSFRDFSKRTRIKWAGLTLALCAGLFLYSGITYFNSKAELAELKKPLALSAGLSLEEPPLRHVVLLRDAGANTVEWPVEFKLYNFFEIEDDKYRPRKDEYGHEIYPATSDNLAKLSDYSGRIKAGAFIQSEYSESLIEGYFAAGDFKKAREILVRHSEDFMINRIVALAMFGVMPTMPENKELLRRFAEGIDWHEDIISAGRLCDTYMDMDMEKEGEKWCALYHDIEGKKLDHDRSAINGSLKGTISINGSRLRDGKVLLAREGAFDHSLYYSGFFRARKLMASSAPGHNGEFEFTGLRAGEYLDYELAVVFDRPLGYEIAGIDNPPGIINVTSENRDIDLGVINIRTKEKE